MYSEIQAPSQRLAREIQTAMRWGSSISLALQFMVLGVLLGLTYYFGLESWANWVLLVLAIFVLISGVWSIGLRPYFTYKNTRYDLNEDFLQLKTGAFYERHELIPMTKIQAVSMNQGPILRRFNLYSLQVETMGSVHGISGLPKEVALMVRNQIALFAKIQEVDEG